MSTLELLNEKAYSLKQGAAARALATLCNTLAVGGDIYDVPSQNLGNLGFQFARFANTLCRSHLIDAASLAPEAASTVASLRNKVVLKGTRTGDDASSDRGENPDSTSLDWYVLKRDRRRTLIKEVASKSSGASLWGLARIVGDMTNAKQDTVNRWIIREKGKETVPGTPEFPELIKSLLRSE